MEEDGCLCAEGSRQRAQRQIGEAVGDGVVDRCVQQLLAAGVVNRSSHLLERL
jgi:hypothetical protein